MDENTKAMQARIEQLEADVFRVMKHAFPGDFKRPAPEPPDPLDDLYGDPAITTDRYLNARWDALTDHRACFLTLEDEHSARDEYMDTKGLFLPPFYVKDGEVVERDTGRVVTEEHKLKRKISACRESLKRMEREGYEDREDWTPLADTRAELQEAQVALAKLQGKEPPKRRDPSEALARARHTARRATLAERSTCTAHVP